MRVITFQLSKSMTHFLRWILKSQDDKKQHHK